MDETIHDLLQRREEYLRRLRGLLVTKLGLERGEDELDPDASLFGTGLALDSIDAIELLIAVQEEFALDLARDDGSPYLAMRTLNTIIDELIAREEETPT